MLTHCPLKTHTHTHTHAHTHTQRSWLYAGRLYMISDASL